MEEFVSKGVLEELSSLLSVPNQSDDVIRFGLQALCNFAEAGKYVCTHRHVIILI